MMIADFQWAALFLSPFGVGTVAIISVFAWLIVASIADAVSSVMKRRTDADLKLELLARGLSPDEIVRIVEAGREQEDSESAEQLYRAAADQPMPSQAS